MLPSYDPSALFRKNTTSCINLRHRENTVRQCAGLVEDDIGDTTSRFQLLWISKNYTRTSSDATGDEHNHWYSKANRTRAGDNEGSDGVGEGFDRGRAGAMVRVVPRMEVRISTPAFVRVFLGLHASFVVVTLERHKDLLVNEDPYGKH